MAGLDVTDVLSDPLFANAFSVVRRVETVNSYGESVVSETTFPAVGVVTSTGNPIARGADEQHQPDTITVHTAFSLTGPAAGVQPDVIVWQGRRWVVVKVSDYSHMGAGFVSADLEALDLVGAAP